MSAKDKETVVLLDENAVRYPQFIELINTVLEGRTVVYVPQFAPVGYQK